MPSAKGRPAISWRKRSAAFHASRASLSGRSHANSSPPIRATRSSGRDRRSSRAPMSRSTSSPIWWPCRSLTSLKWSRSISASDRGRRWRRRALDLVAQALVEGAVVGEPRQGIGGRALLGVGERDERPLVEARVRQGQVGDAHQVADGGALARAEAPRRSVADEEDAQHALAHRGMLETGRDERGEPRLLGQPDLLGCLQPLAHRDAVGCFQDRLHGRLRVVPRDPRLEEALELGIVLAGVDARRPLAVGQDDARRAVGPQGVLGRDDDRLQRGVHVEAAGRDGRGGILHRAAARLVARHGDADELGQVHQARAHAGLDGVRLVAGRHEHAPGALAEHDRGRHDVTAAVEPGRWRPPRTARLRRATPPPARSAGRRRAS